jgi:hypothetical protein
MGAQRARTLAAECNFNKLFPQEAASNLQRVALYYERQRSRPALLTRIRQEVHDGRRPSPILRALARMNFPLVITTTYDQLFERALAAEQRKPRVSVYNPDRYTMTRDWECNGGRRQLRGWRIIAGRRRSGGRRHCPHIDSVGDRGRQPVTLKTLPRRY